LRHYDTSRKVAGSIPDEVTEYFHLAKSFQTHYALGVDSASNRNEYQKIFLGEKERPARKANNLTAISEPIVYKKNVGFPTSHNPTGLHDLLQG
jgi:hypothetical protein